MKKMKKMTKSMTVASVANVVAGTALLILKHSVLSLCGFKMYPC